MDIKKEKEKIFDYLDSIPDEKLLQELFEADLEIYSESENFLHELEPNNPYRDLVAIKKALKEAKKYSLEAEVISFAMMYVANGSTIEEACDMALMEWIK